MEDSIFLVPFRYTTQSGYVFIETVQFAGGQDATSISHDGRTILVTGAVDTTTGDRAYVVAEGRPLRVIEPYGNPPFIYAEAISGDGSTVVGGPFPTVIAPRDAFRWTEAAGMTFLADLPGGEVGAYAQAVSYDGSIAVGWSVSANNQEPRTFEACRWNANGEPMGLGDLPGGRFLSTAAGVSADGRVIVGYGSDDTGVDAFVWTAEAGMRSIKQVLIEAGLGAAVEGWSLGEATGISADGRRVCGFGFDPSGLVRAWVAELPDTSCRADFNADGVHNSQDFFDFLSALFTTPACPEPCTPGGGGGGSCPADFNRDCFINSADFFDFLGAFLAGCE